jgi:hypothetical protein
LFEEPHSSDRADVRLPSVARLTPVSASLQSTRTISGTPSAGVAGFGCDSPALARIRLPAPAAITTAVSAPAISMSSSLKLARAAAASRGPKHSLECPAQPDARREPVRRTPARARHVPVVRTRESRVGSARTRGGVAFRCEVVANS